MMQERGGYDSVIPAKAGIQKEKLNSGSSPE